MSDSSDLQRVLQWFKEGRIVRPRAGRKPTSVELIHAIARVSGAEGCASNAAIETLVQQLGKPRHLLFVLIDGLGVELLHTVPKGFLLRHMRGELEATFPSTTAAALTSISTGTYPAEHGILSWWIYFKQLELIAEILPFVERFTKKSMIELGARSEDVFVTPSLLPRFKHAPLVITRSHICNSTYSRYWAGECQSVGYERISAGVDLAIERVLKADAPSYTYLYLPQLDEHCHKTGTDDQKTRELIELLDAEMARLAHALGDRGRIVVSADHGHVNRQIGRYIKYDDVIMQYLKCPPSGEPTVPMFQVREGCEQPFADMFRLQFGDLFALLSADEVESLELLGPGKLGPNARDHLGQFMAVATEAHTLHYLHPTVKPVIHKGVHCGLSPAEMTVPLVLA